MSRYPLNLPPVARKPRSPVQDLTFARQDIAVAARFVEGAGQPAVAELLRQAAEQIDALRLPPVLALGCWRCDGDVPADVPDLASDRICRACADDYDVAQAERRALMKADRAARRAA